MLSHFIFNFQQSLSEQVVQRICHVTNFKSKLVAARRHLTVDGNTDDKCLFRNFYIIYSKTKEKFIWVFVTKNGIKLLKIKKKKFPWGRNSWKSKVDFFEDHTVCVEVFSYNQKILAWKFLEVNLNFAPDIFLKITTCKKVELKTQRSHYL